MDQEFDALTFLHFGTMHMTDKLNRFADLYKVDNIIPTVAKIVERGEWEQEHKDQYRTTIVEFEDEFFAVMENRSGSYHSDWYYGDTEIMPCARHEETKVVVTYPGTGPGITIEGRY